MSTTDHAAELEIARDHRARSAGYFPMPDGADCALFAMTEIGEYIDAMIRIRGAAYKRNNARNVDIQAELGQVGYMILSAMIAIDAGNPGRADERSRAAAMLGARVAMAIAALAAGATVEHARRELEIAAGAWRHLCALEAADPATLIDMIARQIDAKHAPAPITLHVLGEP